MAQFESAVIDIGNRTKLSKRGIILSGGVDTCAILAAAKKKGVEFAAAITVICGENSPDEGFATAAANEYGIPHHHILSIAPEDLVSIYLPSCVKLLRTFDGMTLRNSLVVAAAFKKASEIGLADVIVGDGADELLGGYSFMWGCADDPVQWKEKRDKMCSNWTFATAALAEFYGLVSHSPYMETKFVDWVTHNVERSDCIAIRPIRLFYNGETQEHQTGKLILREAYETVASWRRKDPIEVGSGITIIGKNEYWKNQITDEEFQRETLNLKTQGFVIKDKESLVNFRAFQTCFGEDGSQLPIKRRLEIGLGCAGCCFEIGTDNFCNICGAFPAQRQ